MRCYHFCNMCMSSIQQGIQAAHAQMELALKCMFLHCVDYESGVLSYADLEEYKDKKLPSYNYTEYELTLIRKLNNYSLAK